MGTFPVLIALSIVAFALVEFAPGDPAVKAASRSGRIPNAEEVEAYREQLHLGDAAPIRYLRWAESALGGDLGTSYDTSQPVTAIIRDTLPPTLLLAGCGLALAWILALGTGIAAGMAPGSIFARALGVFIAILVGAPSFVVALVMLWGFAVTLTIFPTGGMTTAGADVSPGQLAQHVALPALAIAVSYFGWYARVIEAGVAETNRQQFVVTARAKGLPPGIVVRRHILRSALVPFVTQAGASLGALVGGIYAVEVVFSWPGLGRTALRAGQLQDFPVVVALVLLSGLVVTAGNLLADLAIAWLDPRVRLSGGTGG